jgi:hypothetical protein
LNPGMLFAATAVLGDLSAQFRYPMPPAIIFDAAALCFSETATFKMKGRGSCAHFGKKLEVNGLKASWANVL